MTQLLCVDEQRRDQIVTEAADRNMRIVLSHRLDSGWSTYKSRILRADSAGEFLEIEQPIAAPHQVPPELAPGEKIGLSFRRGHKKCLCTVEVIKPTQVDFDDGQSCAAVQVTWPETLQEVQRRVFFRAMVPAGRRIEVCMWDGGILDRGTADLERAPHHTGLLQDVSAGGCRVLIDAAKDPHLEVGETVCIQFQPDPRSEPIRCDALYRHLEKAARGQLSLGFQFVGMEMSQGSRGALQAISRVVSTFLRIDMRRKKNRLQKVSRRR